MSGPSDVQDDWRIRSNLTLNFGLRYEPHTTVDEIRGRGLTLRDPLRDAAFTPGPPLFDNDSWKNWGPRFGFAWDVLGNASTSVRGGFALLYDITSNIGNTAVHGTANPPLSSSATLTSNLTFPRTVVPASAAGRSIRTFDYHLQQPHMLHWNLTVERQLPLDMAVSLAYAASRGINLLQSKEGNPTIPSGVRSGNACVRAGASFVYDPSGPKCWLGNEPRLNPAFAGPDERNHFVVPVGKRRKLLPRRLRDCEDLGGYCSCPIARITTSRRPSRES